MRDKKQHIAEKQHMQERFDAEILKTLVEVQDQTMQTIATELHDNVGQLLSLTTLTLNSINLENTDKASKKIENSLSLVNKSIKELRELAKLLHGEQLIENGLGHAIDQEINWLSKAGAYEITINNHLTEILANSPNKDLIILRLLQEIINNIIKHAQATSIQFDAYLNNDVLHLQVKDNGVGFNVEEAGARKSGMGLNSIHKRVEMINGKIQLNSSPDSGTTTLIEIPYP
ncbi:sensor histidine kinase [Pedobacter sp. AW1-32]|uniref:sensor histidine kinase n=1 Tax=Pedobacter sp. AW1-32 TaxID=3383026 RepID=UPI003FED498C